jgi:hypothetical protein
MLAILLRHHAMCLTITYICVNLFIAFYTLLFVGHFFFVTISCYLPFLCSCSHFMLSESFRSCLSAILCHGSNFMISQSFLCCVSAISDLCQLIHVLLVILFFVSHFIYFVPVISYVPDLLGCFSHLISPFY